MSMILYCDLLVAVQGYLQDEFGYMYVQGVLDLTKFAVSVCFVFCFAGTTIHNNRAYFFAIRGTNASQLL